MDLDTGRSEVCVALVSALLGGRLASDVSALRRQEMMKKWVDRLSMAEHDHNDRLSIDGIDSAPNRDPERPEILVTRELVDV